MKLSDAIEGKSYKIINFNLEIMEVGRLSLLGVGIGKNVVVVKCSKGATMLSFDNRLIAIGKDVAEGVEVENSFSR